jgi:DNA adenine methylase
VSPAVQPKARPFLKWAGGKRQLLPQIDHYLPETLKAGSIIRYVEPFVGSGAVFFHVAQKYAPHHLVISDFNPELIRAYRTIQRRVADLIPVLQDIENYYLPLGDAARKRFYYEQRSKFNEALPDVQHEPEPQENVERTAQLIFLNRTCYNGLFRVNSKGEFNVPSGRYKNPTICDAVNLQAVADLLQRTEIRFGPYDNCDSVIDGKTMVYFDPPYRPISKTANFTAYSQRQFDDEAQLDLARFYRKLDKQGARLMLSNSDPQNIDPDDSFFETAYAGFRIVRVQASRRINSRAEKRGLIYELLILNY